MDVAQAIRALGAQAVYDAATRHMAGDVERGLQSVGLTAKTMADVWSIQSAAYAELGDAAKAIDLARAQAALTKIEQSK
jgi:hypothetical protein